MGVRTLGDKKLQSHESPLKNINYIHKGVGERKRESSEVWDRRKEGLKGKRCKGVNNSLYIFIYIYIHTLCAYLYVHIFVFMPAEIDQTPLSLHCAALMNREEGGAGKMGRGVSQEMSQLLFFNF